MEAPAQQRSIDAAAYADYLRTVEGRLRADLAWENLCAFLPSPRSRRALDVGGGTGEMAVRLAGCGFQVTVLDSSESMLAETERAAAEAGVYVSLVCGGAEQLSHLFTPACFDIVVCHNVLEFVESPTAVLQAINLLLTQCSHAVGSVIVRNRAGEVLSAIKNGDLIAAEHNLTASKVYAKLVDEVSVFSPADLRRILAEAGLSVVAEYGVRVCSDYLPESVLNDPANYPPLLALEQKLGRQAAFAAIARYTQVIVRPTAIVSVQAE